ncbi:kynureninase [Salegentibacter mishustinae]|uniref:Kynureninase n=1 Tax=Salegentibacter mishustinae TaxID=270918 RepID=A0A0Q9ZBL3_9FLAO|nr:kynureninase [Salegentibacter mishustinae]KRG30422.1 kynureninase [Salegentibacter mishustinae]PNW23315.1 kynureninase [Salegentibacter mishustinae]PZX66379.1 kynureninase [Salegentibacter mishustinae]GGW82153.1 kynureninase [Salegentibacter mishustinae]
MKFKNTLEYARELDAEDKLSSYRDQFIFPQHEGENVIYFTGNSLGLQPKSAKKYVDEIMTDWANLAVEGHFYAEKPWWDYHERFSAKLAKVVGAKPAEVTVMNTLTVNLHLLMVSFYRPKGKRYKIICEEKAFPSDQYMISSQVRFHGYDPNEAIVEIKRREGENNFRTEDILAKIKEVGEQCALVLIGGVNYYTGQVLAMETITRAGHEIGAFVGWDLAHAAGNIELNLSEWNVDFAAWCSYKYMNSGPGNASGCFINEKYHNQKDIPRFEGWWGHSKERRFLMEPEFQPENGADAWQISNAPVLALAPYLASLEMFEEVGMPALIEKRNKIVAYLEFVLHEIDKEVDSTFEIITPANQEERGTQLSVFLHGEGRELFNYLMKNGVITDWREPNVIRLAPAPFYCSFEDMFHFGQILKKGILEKSK